MGISPVIIGGAIAAGGAVAGSAISASGAKSAANTQQQAAQDANSTQIYLQQQAINEQNQMLGVEGQLMNPSRISGNYAQQALEYALGLPQTNLQSVTLPDGSTLAGNSYLNTQMGGPQVGYGGAGGASGLPAGYSVMSPRIGQQIMGNPQPGQQNATGFLGANGPAYGVTANGQTIGGTGAAPTVMAMGQAGQGGQYGMSPTQQQSSNPLSTLFTPFSYTASDYQQSPGFQFALGQGLQAIENSASARGMTLSPNTQQSLAQYAVGLADQDFQQSYQNAYNAYTQNQSNVLNSLGSMAGYGNTAATNLGSAASNTGSNVSSLLSSLGSALGSNTIGAGNAAAAGTIGSSNAISGGLSSLGNIYTQSQLLNSFLSPNSGASGGYGFQMPATYSQPSYGLGSGLNYNLNQ
jgi:hypothetical protein